MDISTEIVSQFYITDLETEDVIFGKDLENGMIVLIEAGQRVNEEHLITRHTEYQLRVKNRWCLVTELWERDVRPGYSPKCFMAVYGDGEKIARDSDPSTGWVVKKDSIPGSPNV